MNVYRAIAPAERRRIFRAAVALILACGPLHAAGNDVISLDVVLADERGRPVTNLAPGDVEVLDGGEPRSVDDVRPHVPGRRVIGIFLDEFHVGAGEATERARAALIRFVDTELRDGDLVAVAKPLDPLHAIALTTDRDAVRLAIEAFEGHAGDFTPRSEFERNFLSRDPRTAAPTRAQIASAALQALSRRLADEQDGRKALVFVSEGFRPAQPRAIIQTANRAGVSLYPVDPEPSASDGEPILQALAAQTGGAASLNETDLSPAFGRVVRDLDQHVIVAFTASRKGDGGFRPVQIRVKRPGIQARARPGYWTADPARAAAAAAAIAPHAALPFRPSHASPYIRPWVGMSRGAGDRTTVTVAWEPGAQPPRNQQVVSVQLKATAADGSVLHESSLAPGARGVATFEAAPGRIGLEIGIRSSTGATLDTDYRGMTVPDLRVTRPTIATPRLLRTRTARDFAEASRNATAIPSPSRVFSRAERLIVRVPAYGPGDTTPVVGARLLNRRGTAMRELARIDADMPPGIVQFDLPLSSLAPDEYSIELTASNPSGRPDQARELVPFRIVN